MRTVVGVIIVLIAAGGWAARDLPNVIIIMPDDLGSRDVGFRGGEIATPNIDRIAREGVTFDRFYTAPVCSPTRAGLMTGRYPIRYGLMSSVVAAWTNFGLDTSETTLPEVLARAGYEHRAIFGKWHLGHHKKRWHPLRRGFTEFKGYNAAIDFFTHENMFLGERDWWHDYESVDEPGYLTDLHAEHSVQFINAHAADSAPFFLYVPFSAPHIPQHAKEQHLPLYAHLDELPEPRGWSEAIGRPVRPNEERRAGRRIHAAMVHSLDEGVGRILNALDAHDIADNTLVLFFSDNGGAVAMGDNEPFSGAKATVFEGGVRVVAAGRWPAGNMSGGREIKTPIQYIDILPTLMGIAGIADHGGKPLDGLNMSGVLTGEDADIAPDRALFSFLGGQTDGTREQLAVTDGDWKLVVVGPNLTKPGATAKSRTYLFRITSDPFEQHNLASKNPDVVARLVSKARDFRALRPAIHVPPFRAGMEEFKPPRNWEFSEE
jgi:arylsulfatase B